MRTHSVGFNIVMMSFGCSCVALGYLSSISAEFPRPSASSWRLRAFPSTAQLLSPRLASMLFPLILVPASIGELSFALWLTAKGVNVAGWKEKAGLAIASL
jgi:Domain of unknown function (DUF4386)